MCPSSPPATDSSPPPREGGDVGEKADLPPRHDQLDEGEQSYVHVEQIDPTAELIAAKSWEDLGLKESLLKAAYAKGFAKPSKIQAVALPLILEPSRPHLLAQAKNGAGKTATFSLAAISSVDENNPHVQVLLLAPSRELAKQNQDVIDDLAKFTQVKSFLACPPVREMPSGVHIVSGTPGKVQDFIKRKILRSDHVHMFILDEADVMVDESGSMGTQVVEIAKKVKARKNLQILLFSATFPERVRCFAMAMAPHANRIVMKKEDLTLSTTTQYWMKLASTDSSKMEALIDLYSAMSIGQSVIFVGRRDTAEKVANRMRDEKYSVTLICGGQGVDGLNHEKRQARMEEFRNGITRVLVTTDLLARGIDVPSVTLVINYDLPMSFTERGEIEYETYLHRVGRTGRFGQKGVAINFVTGPAELEYIRKIEQYYGSEIKELDSDFEKIEKMMQNLRV